ncbi:MAG: chromate transporter [Firmicutes bacterium]|nr:chromate transporter [Bacillota bacterium]
MTKASTAINNPAEQPAPAKYSELFWVFAKIGLFTVGGGAVMLPLIQNSVVQEKRWLNDEEFTDMLALTNSAPGAFTINASLYIGYGQRGLSGATVAMLGMVTPSVVIIVLLAYLILMGKNVEILQQFFAGVRPIVAALLLDAAFKLRKDLLKTKFDWLLVSLGLAMIVLAGLNTVFVILAGAVISVLYNRQKLRQQTDIPKEGAEK